MLKGSAVDVLLLPGFLLGRNNVSYNRFEPRQGQGLCRGLDSTELILFSSVSAG